MLRCVSLYIVEGKKDEVVIREQQQNQNGEVCQVLLAKVHKDCEPDNSSVSYWNDYLLPVASKEMEWWCCSASRNCIFSQTMVLVSILVWFISFIRLFRFRASFYYYFFYISWWWLMRWVMLKHRTFCPSSGCFIVGSSLVALLVVVLVGVCFLNWFLLS